MTKIELHPGDNRETLRRLIDEGVRVHSICTDPPYGLVSVQKRFGKEASAPARTEKNDGSFARLSGGFMGKCFHPDTDVLTDLGWRKVGDLRIGDVVATLDPITRQLVWQAVGQLHRYPFDGKMVHVRHRSSEQVITPNHKMVVSRNGGESLELLMPAELPRKFHLFAQCKPKAGRKDFVKIRSAREYGKDRAEIRKCEAEFEPSAFFRFFGLWLGDGYTVKRSDDHPANDFFGINVKKSRKIVAVREALQNLGIKFTESPQSNGFTAFYCYDFALLGWLQTLGGAKEKRIPSFLLEWDAEYLEYLYLGLMDSDGCRQGKNQEVLQTSSRALADDFQVLCLATGRSAAITLREGGRETVICGRETTASDAWLCCVLQPGKRMYGESSATNSNVIHEMQHVGEVFCIGVPEHHILYTRFNGKPVWSGNSWDATGIERDPEFWKLIYEILLPGGYVFAFSGSRTGHWQACAMEMAGFIMHPMHGWCFGSGFPKAHAADKAIDKALGVEREVVGTAKGKSGENLNRLSRPDGGDSDDAKGVGAYGQGAKQVTIDIPVTHPGSPEAAQWEGWAYGTQAQKPALEPIYLGQKPFSEKTGAANLLKHGVGAVNIDGCRVPSGDETSARSGGKRPNTHEGYQRPNATMFQDKTDWELSNLGRHPANLILDGSPEVVAMFPNSNGSGSARTLKRGKRDEESGWGMSDQSGELRNAGTGSAARFFHQFAHTEDDVTAWRQIAGVWPCGEDADPLIYHPKAGKADRAGSKHPTVKPIALMQYLIRHITPPGGVVLDPFAGSGTTAEAAKREGFDCILMEAEDEYVDFLRQRFDLAAEGTFDFEDDLLGLDEYSTECGFEELL